MTPPGWLEKWLREQSRRTRITILGSVSGGIAAIAAAISNYLLLPDDPLRRGGVLLAVGAMVLGVCWYGLMRLERWIVMPTPFSLLQTYYSLTDEASPRDAARHAYEKCVHYGGYSHVYQLARVYIELRIWKQPLSKDEPFLSRFAEHLKEGGAGGDFDEVCIDNCFVLTGQIDLICAYFRAVAKAGPEDPLRDRFLTEARVEKGYVSYQQLLTGLITTYEDGWADLLEEFSEEAGEDAELFAETGFKRTQLFTFYCWLLWGPSVPLGACSQWRKDGGESSVALQYGFGDENNSLPLYPLVNGEEDDDHYASLVRFVASSPFATRLQIKVRPVFLPPYADATTQDVQRSLERLGNAQRSIWRANARSVDSSAEDDGGTVVLDYSTVYDIDKVHNKAPVDPREYYSAYIWIMFVLVDRETGLPVFSAELTKQGPNVAGIRGDRPWNGLFPFFEHGNIADDTAYAIFKRQLAQKALASMAELLQEPMALQHSGKVVPSVGDRYCFQYACASDDGNCIKATCGRDLSRHSHRSRVLIRDHLCSLLTPNAGDGTSVGAFERLHPHVRMEPPMSWSDDQRRAFSACHLPELIELYYNHVKENKSRRTARKPRA